MAKGTPEKSWFVLHLRVAFVGRFCFAKNDIVFLSVQESMLVILRRSHLSAKACL